MPEITHLLEAAAAEAMRRVLVNHARDRTRLKRGDGRNRVDLEALLAAHDGAGRFLEGDPTGIPEATSPEIVEATATSGAETRLPSEAGTAEDRPDGTIVGPAPADHGGGSGVGQVIAGRRGRRCQWASALPHRHPLLPPSRLSVCRTNRHRF